MKSPAITATLEGKNKTLYLQVRQYQYSVSEYNNVYYISVILKVLFVYFRPLPQLKKEQDQIFAKH